VIQAAKTYNCFAGNFSAQGMLAQAQAAKKCNGCFAGNPLGSSDSSG